MDNFVRWDKWIGILFGVVLASILLPTAIAQVPALTDDVPRLQVNPGETLGSFGDKALVLDDPSVVTAGQALSRWIDFSRFDNPNLNFGRQPSPIWVALVLENVSEQAFTGHLQTGRTSVNVLEIFLATDAGPRPIIDYADLEQRRESFDRYGYIGAGIDFGPRQDVLVLMRFQAEASGWLPLRFVPENNLFLDRMGWASFFIASAAAVVTLVLFNLLMFVFTRQPLFVWYSISVLMLLAGSVHLQGHTTVYLFPDNPALGRIFGGTTQGLAAGILALFAREYLLPRQERGPVFWLLRGLTWVGVGYALLMVVLALVAFDEADRLILGGWLLIVITVMALASLAVWATAHGQTGALPLALGWGVSAIYMLITMASTLGMIEPVSLHWHLASVMIFFEAAMMALSLALRVRALAAERETLAQENYLHLKTLNEKARSLLAIGHDSRNLLSALNASSSQIRDDQDGRMLEIIQSLSSVMDSLMEDGYTMRGATGPLLIDQVSINRLFNSLSMAFSGEAHQRSVTLDFRAVPASLATDRTVLYRCLANLISNALRHADTARILVTARSGSGGTRFQVWDQGRGIDAANLDRLMRQQDGGHRLHDSGPGTGLGLQICQRMSRSLGGHVTARSIPGRGAMFEVFLPWHEPTQTPVIPLVIIDDPRNWERLSRMPAVSPRIRTIWDEAPSADDLRAMVRQAVVLADPNRLSDRDIRLINQEARHLVLLSHDRSLLTATGLSGRSDMILVQPISLSALWTCLHLLDAMPAARARPLPLGRRNDPIAAH